MALWHLIRDVNRGGRRLRELEEEYENEFRKTLEAAKKAAEEDPEDD